MSTKLMRRIGWMLVMVMVLSLLAACGDDDKKEKPASYTIGILNFVPQLEQAIQGFKEGLSEFGYVEGENITYIQKTVESPDQLGAAGQELVDAKVDLIFASGTYEAQAVQGLTSDIPIVFGVSSDPVGAGLVTELARPGGNVTGIMMPGGDQKRLQLFTEALPSLKRIYVPYNPDDIGPARMVEAIKDMGADLGIELVFAEVHNMADAETVITDMPDDIDGIFVGPDDLMLGSTLIAASIEDGIPISVPMAALPTDIIFMGYGPDLAAMGKQAARIAEQILKGTKVGDLPVEPAELYLTVSLVAAEQLHLDVSDSVLGKANTILRPEE